MSKVSKPYTKQTKEERKRFEEGYDRVFGKKKKKKS
jgi:hypothetical protein